jgi:hypothetical protein
MTDFQEHSEVRTLREQCQTDEQEMRERVREQARFLKKRDGQWEDGMVRKFGSRPRYQLDYTSRVVNDICAEIEQNEFGGRVISKGAQSNDEISEVYDGIMRSLQNMSNAATIYKSVGRHIVERGFDAFLLTQGWADVDAFEQDLLWRPIKDAINRVWVDTDWAEADRSDSRFGFMDSMITPAEFRKEFGKDRAPSSLSNPQASMSTTIQSEREASRITICDFYYIETESKLLHLMSDGRVVSDADYQPVAADWAVRGITVERSRTRDIKCCYMRKFDNAGWLTEPKKTVFGYIPLVTAYGNLDYVDGELIYFGETEKLMDPQRVFNYARSREIEDTAFAPRRKIFMTPAQAKGHEAQLRTLNINSDPVQFYNPDEKAPSPPYESQGPQINPALEAVSQQTAQDIQNISGNFAPSQGKPISGHSGVAYELLQNKSDSGNNHYLDSLKQAIALGCKIAVDAIPKIYDTRSRQVRVMKEDGKVDFVTVNDEVNGHVVHDLAQGHYDFEPVAGPSFQNRKQEGLNTFLELYRINPELMADGGDLVINSMEAPYTKQLGERVRASLIREGRIPEDQLTDKEREKVIQEMEASQNQPPDPMQELTLQAFAAQIQQTLADAQAKSQQAADDHARTITELAQKAAQTEKTMAETLKLLREAMGADKIISPAAAEAYSETAQDLVEHS